MTAPPNRPPGKGSEDPDDEAKRREQAIRQAMMVSLWLTHSLHQLFFVPIASLWELKFFGYTD